MEISLKFSSFDFRLMMPKKLTIEIPYEHQNSDENTPDPLIPPNKLIDEDDGDLALETRKFISN